MATAKNVLYTGGNRVPLEPELVSCKLLRARQRERNRFLWGSVVYGCVWS